jgi:type 1 glutamine amidotransferase
MLMTIRFGKGRIFHTPMGHEDVSVECVGFITCLQRGAEWAATGRVTQKIPEDFPTADKSSSREFKR